MKLPCLKPEKTYFPVSQQEFTHSPPFLLFAYICCICSGNRYGIAVYMENDKVSEQNIIKYVEEQETTLWKKFGLNLFSLMAMKFLSV